MMVKQIIIKYKKQQKKEMKEQIYLNNGYKIKQIQKTF